MYSITVSCPRGLETVLAQEISKLTPGKPQIGSGMIKLEGDLATVYRLNLQLRTASRVLVKIGAGTVGSEHEVYLLARTINWQELFAVTKTINVRVEGQASWCRRFDFLALKIKDAVCDAFTAAGGSRPDVAKQNPAVRIVAHIYRNQAQLYLDSSGEALFKRGWRHESGIAPIRENLAAGLLMLAGFDGTQNFLDPMCGSGTIAVEAALLATQTPPGLNRTFAFMQLKNYNGELWQQIHREAKEQIILPSCRINAADSSPGAVAQAKRNAAAAEVHDFISFNCLPLQQQQPRTSPGIIVTNPPYGERLADESAVQMQYPEWAKTLKQNYSGWTAGFMTADLSLPQLMRLTPHRKIPLFNGPLECRFFLFSMVAGSNRKKT